VKVRDAVPPAPSTRVTTRYDGRVIVDPPPGLCATCRWRQDVAGARSSFVLCRRGLDDPRFPKYPPLPVRHCAGFESTAPGDAPPGRPVSGVS